MGYTLSQSTTPKTKSGRYERSQHRESQKIELQKDENQRQEAASVLMDMSAATAAYEGDHESSPPPKQKEGM